MNDFASAHRLSLTLKQWAGVLVFSVVVVIAAPRVWKAVEPLETGPTYRIPYDLSNDYWLWSRWAEKAAATHDRLLIGDSVVWGQYVKPGETLSDHLNALDGGVHAYANLGVNGMQPAVLAGLIEHYGGAIRDRDVILHCNPLWMSSPKHDLREDEALINHAQLLPQFVSIPGYKEDVEARLSRIVDRNLPFRGWTNHLQVAYFDNASIPSWTKSHPRENPLGRVTLKLPPPEEIYHQEPVAWTVRGIKPSDMPWMALEESFQFKQFRRALGLLQARGNRVKVVVGPFNEHMLKPDSLARYAKLRDGIRAALESKDVAVVVPAALPSATYGDASHPLAAGYRILARRILGLPEEAPAVEVASSAAPGAPVGGDFVKLPGGTFRMGDDAGRADEKPAREARVEPFYLERTPVTQEVYEKVMGVNPAKRKAPKNPVERVQWTDAVRFLNRCSELDGLSPCYDPKTWACDFEADGYRLPTEAEWEYACRAGSAGRWAVDPAELSRFAWFKGNSEGRTHPVGQREPNAFGLHDMNGNVWQWCDDWYLEGKPFGSAQGKQRVLRGGAWDSDAEKLRVAYRSKEFPTYTDACFGADSYGFRRARSGAGRKKTVAVSAAPVEAPKEVATAQAAPGKLDASTLKGTIVFVGDRDGRLDLWIMKASGKDAKRLTDDAHPDADPRFSPDGKKILYTTLRGGFPEVWSMNRDGSGAAKIAPGSQADWSPDGTSIVFIRDNQAWTRALAGGAERRITPEAWERCGVPAWAPDGKRVALASRHEESIGVYLVPLDGAAPSKLPTEEACCTPAFARDGSRLLCQSVKGHIHQVAVDGKDWEQVTFGADIQHDARYSPDGAMIVFSRAPTADGPWQICVKPFDSGDFDFVQLTKEGSNSHPDWIKD